MVCACFYNENITQIIMSVKLGKGRVSLKEYFEADKMPSEGDFEDLIDSSLNKTDDQLFIKAEGDEDNAARFLGIGTTDPKSPLSIRNRTNGHKLIGFEDVGGDEEWHISINPEEGTQGFLIQNNDKPDVALLIDATGRVGIGTKQPEEDLHVNGTLKLKEGVAINEISEDPKLISNSDAVIPTQKAVKTYIDFLFVGSVSAFAMETTPEGWLECNGQLLSRAEYPILFSRIGTTFGASNGSTFKVPDLRGEFIRGFDNNKGVDDNRTIGNLQLDQLQNHEHIDEGHTHTDSGHGHTDSGHYHGSYHRGTDGDPGGGEMSDAAGNGHWRSNYIGHANIQTSYAKIQTARAKIGNPTNCRNGSETRPRNIALLYCIKY
ncbi:MAG: hypothetical protein ACI8ZM_000493 [Crocinitomix sp.]|jgi:hypothetical protein